MPSTKLLSLFLSFCLILEQSVFAQAIDLSHYFANSGKTILQGDKFRPLHLRYISYDTKTNDFQILLDKGDAVGNGLKPFPTLEDETQELMKYFFIGLALPNEKFWVNLRPDSPDNILDPDLEKTDIGRIFLEADLQLKKDTSGMTSPQTKEGKEYWDKLYKKAEELFDSQNITIPAITRPWIVPGEIIIGESPEGAYIYKATLKVMLEEDYLRGMGDEGRGTTTNYSFKDSRLKELNEYSTQLIKETIIPKLTYAVNTSKRYAPLRQVYYSLILAQWFKEKYGSLGSIRATGTSAPVNSYINLIDSGNLANLTSKEPYDKQAYFRQYQKSFADGEYNLQEPVYTPTGQNIRRYMSGGGNLTGLKTSSSIIPRAVEEPITQRAYLINPALSSPINSQQNIEETAQKLTDALFDPTQKNKRLFIWKEWEGGKKHITPGIFKKILENMNYERARNPEFARTMRPEEISIALAIRIITDTIKMDGADPAKSQTQLFKDVIYDYIAIKNGQSRSEQQKKHINEYISRFGKSIPRIYSLITNIKNRLEKILDFKPILPIFEAWHNLFRQQNDIDLILKWGGQLKKHRRGEFLSMREMPNASEEPNSLSKAKETISLWGDFRIKICGPEDADKFNYYWNPDKKGNIFYLRNINNIETKRDIWITFYGQPGREINKFFIGWFNENIDEFEFSDDDIPLPVNGIIDLTQLTRYKGVKRLLSSSSAAEEMKKDWETFQHSLNKKGFSLPDFRKRELPLETHEFIKELQTGKLRIIFFVLKKNESQFHSYEFYLIDDKPIGYGINELKENNTVDIAMHIFKETRGIYSKDIWEHRLDSLLKIYNDTGIGNKKIKSLLVRPSQFSYSQPYGDIAEGPRALIFYLKRGFRPEAPDLYADINKILRKLGNGGDELFKEAGDDLLKVGINRMLLYLPIDNDKGGIDFHALPIETRQIDSLQSLADSPLAINPNLDFEGEWRGIQMVFNAGIRPSARRMAEFAASAGASPLNSRRLEDLRGLVTDLLRRDEEDEKPAPADPALKELLAIL